MPVEALRAGAKLVIINHGETPLDTHAHLRFHESAGEVLPQAVALMKHKLRG
jgi:NAD-dependent SIR2 family protein deacetylase